MTDHDPQADQVAAARREANRRHATLESGEEAAVRTYTVDVTNEEVRAIAAGEMPPRIQAQIDRQLAEDEVIAAMGQGT